MRRGHNPEKGASIMKRALLSALVFAFPGLVGAGCWDQGGTDPPFDGMLFNFCMMSATGSESLTYTDLGNGVIERRVDRVTKTACGSFPAAGTLGHIKKCVQGQVFRSAQNDCRGTGTAGDNWGAQRYQFCTTNDTACDKGYYADPSLSPAAITCAQESTGSGNWRLDDRLGHYGSALPSALFAMLPDVPLGTSNHFWGRGSFADKAAFYVVQADGAFGGSTELKTTMNLAHCVSGGLQ